MTRVLDTLRTLQDHRRLAERVLLLVTVRRSGSTLLFDALRCHPLIDVLPSATISRRLKLAGRRYPRDLSGGDATLKVEVEPGRWEHIPDPAQEVHAPRLDGAVYAIEKLHPFFFGGDVAGFDDRLERIRTPSVKLIYAVRDPAECIRSFIAYQKRMPSWTPNVRPHEAPREYRKGFQALLELSNRRPGLVIDYSELTEDLGGVLRRVRGYLWPNRHEEPWWDDFVRDVIVATSVERRGNTPFLGAGAGRKKDAIPDLPGSREDLDACYEAYHALRRSGSAYG